MKTNDTEVRIANCHNQPSLSTCGKSEFMPGRKSKGNFLEQKSPVSSQIYPLAWLFILFSARELSCMQSLCQQEPSPWGLHLLH